MCKFFCSNNNWKWRCNNNPILFSLFEDSTSNKVCNAACLHLHFYLLVRINTLLSPAKTHLNAFRCLVVLLKLFDLHVFYENATRVSVAVS